MKRCALLFAALFMAAPAMGHKGDGRYTDKGASTAHNRFELDLGLVDLERSGRSEYRFSDLPSDEFTFGLRLTAPHGERLRHLPKATVRMTLLNERDEVVFDVSGELINWVRSEGANEWFVYLRGIQKEVPVAQGKTRLERISFGPDGGWGTYVSPRANGTYRLAFETVKADVSMSKFVVRLVGIGGGWK